MPVETVRVAFLRDQTDRSLLDGVTMRVFDAAGALVTQSVSGEMDAGTAQVELEGDADGADYQLRFFLPGTAIAPRRIRVYSPASAAPSLTNDFLITVETFALPPAVNPRMCRASGHLQSALGRPLRNIDLAFLPKFDAFVDETSVALSGRFIVRTDDKGFASVDLYRRAMYEVMIDAKEPVVRTIEVPDRNSILLAHLLFPVVVAVAWDVAPPFTIARGTTLYLRPSVIATDYRDLGLGIEDVLYQTLDPSVASVQVLSDRIAIRGLSTGTTTLRVSRLDRSIVYLPDFAIEGGDLPIVVTS